MQCPITPELWQYYQDTGDAQVAAHLASCDSCRTEAGRLATLEHALASLTVTATPEAVTKRFQALHTATEAQSLTCAETLAALEAWREGELPSAQAFLVEDHLLWCAPCAVALEQAELLTTALRRLPMVEVPDAIAERIAQARVPWWQRLLPAPAPSWSRQLGMAAGLAAALMLMFGSILQTPRMASVPAPKIATPMAPLVATNPDTSEQQDVTVAVVEPVARPAVSSHAVVRTATVHRQLRKVQNQPKVGVKQQPKVQQGLKATAPVPTPKNETPVVNATSDPVVAVQPNVSDTEERVRLSSIPSDTSPQRIIETEVKAAKWGEDETNYSDAVNNIRLRL